MLTLALETSNPTNAAAVALGIVHPAVAAAPRSIFAPVDVQLLALEPLRPVSRHEDDLTPAIARCCDRAGVTPRELEQVAVSAGPGGYTSLRMSVAAAKMIAAATGARTISVPTAAAVARAMQAQLNSTDRIPFAVALAGKQTTTHLTIFASIDGPAGAPTDNPIIAPAPGRLIDADDIPALVSAGVRSIIADRFLPEPIRAAAAGAGIDLIAPVFDAAAVLDCAGLTGSAGIRTVDPVELLPIYGREPEAVRLWRERPG